MPSPLRPLLRVLLGLAIPLLLAPALAAAGPPAPDAPGPWPVGRTGFEVVDESREGRTLPVDVWYPAAPGPGAAPSVYQLLFLSIPSERALADPPVAEGRFPLVVFSHGNGGVRYQSFFLTELLASHGFVVVSADHVGNTLIEAIAGDLDQDAVLQSGLDRPRDVSLLIDVMLARSDDPSDPFAGRIDSTAIGVSGHSFGGFTSLAMAAGVSGAIADEFGGELPPGFEPIPPDRRVRAIAPLAPASDPFTDAELAGVRIPVLLVGGTADATTPIDPQVTRPFAELGAPRVYRADVADAGHFSFTNVCDLIAALEASPVPPDLFEDFVEGAFEEGCAPELIPVDEAQRLTNRLVVAFFQRHLARDRRYQRFLRERPVERAEPAVDFASRLNPGPPALELLRLILEAWLSQQR